MTKESDIHTNGTFKSVSGKIEVAKDVESGATEVHLKGFEPNSKGVLRKYDQIDFQCVAALSPFCGRVENSVYYARVENFLARFFVQEDVNSNASGEAIVSIAPEIRQEVGHLYNNVSELPTAGAEVFLLGGGGARHTFELVFPSSEFVNAGEMKMSDDKELDIFEIGTTVCFLRPLRNNWGMPSDEPTTASARISVWQGIIISVNVAFSREGKMEVDYRILEEKSCDTYTVESKLVFGGSDSRREEIIKGALDDEKKVAEAYEKRSNKVRERESENPEEEPEYVFPGLKKSLLQRIKETIKEILF